jgi:hypothetical protein
MEKEEEILIGVNQKAFKISKDLLSTAAIVARGGSFPKQRGIYLWRSMDGEIVYIGVGNGEKGLKGRIGDQHLCKSYRKSVFRIKISTEYEIDIGHECIEYILDNFKIAFLPYPDKYFSEAAEKLLIAAFRPKYNA